MTSYLVLIALVNTALGFAIAVYLLPPTQLSGLPIRVPCLLWRRSGSPAKTDEILMVEESNTETLTEETGTQKEQHTPDTPAPADESNACDVEAPTSTPELVEQIPDEWLSTLDEYGIKAASIVEASTQVLRLEVGAYRDQLVRVDSQARRTAGNTDIGMLRMFLEELNNINATWMEKQSDSTRHLESRAGALGDHGGTASRLLEILENQQAQIETTAGNLSGFDVDADPAKCERLILTEIRRLLDLAHALRDRMFEMLLDIKKLEDRLCDINQSMMFDGLTNLHNRAGLEKVLHDQFISDQGRQRQVCCSLIDVDRFTRLMDQYGPVACDRLLQSLGQMVDSLMRHDRGFDLSSRFDGQRFLVLLADTGPRNATSAVERIRQTIEETTFEFAGSSIGVTVQCGVAELGSHETTDAFFGRLEAAIATAKRAGRNCTVLDEGNGPEKVAAPKYDVKGRIVSMD